MDIKRNYLRMWRKGVSLLCITALATVSFSGCTLKTNQKEEEKSQGELDVYREIELTESEMEQTHLTAEDFRDKVKIDAQITPYHLYKDGVDIYYNLSKDVQSMDDNTIKLGKKVKDAKVEDLTYFGKPVDEIVKIMETEDGRKPRTEKMDWKFRKKSGDHEISIPFIPNSNGDDTTLEMCWKCFRGKNSKELDSLNYNFEIKSEAGARALDLANEIKYEHVPYNTEDSLSFADSRATAGMLREMLTELTGHEYSEDYDVIPMDSDVIDQASKNLAKWEQGEGTSGSSKTTPCYYYCFYQELDGLPIRNSTDSIMAAEGMNLSEELLEEIKDKDKKFAAAQIDNYCSPSVEIIYNETGIILLQLGVDSVYGTEPAGEKKAVINLSDVLEPLYEYFDSIVSIDTTVYEIRLGYRASFTSYLTDDTEGEPIRRALTPVWIVKYDTQINGKRGETACFDAYTGEYLEFAIVY